VPACGFFRQEGSARLPDMRRVAVLSLLMCIAGWAGPKRRLWQDATVIKIAHSVSEAEEVEYKPSPSTGGGVVTSDVTTRRTKTWTYTVKTDQHLYLGQVEKRPVEGVREGDRIRIAVQRGNLYVLTPGAKEHRLELLKTE
jgi:hypothetical protein